MAPIWISSFSNELGRLATGLPSCNIDGTNTIEFIHPSSVPPHRMVTYVRIVVDIKPHKAEKHRTRLTVGGNLLKYTDSTFTPTADLTTIKLLLNSKISTPNALFLSCDISNFYLNTHLHEPEYMQLPLKYLPQEIITHYNLLPLIHQ